MKRIFNTTGTCIPARHFVADIFGKVEQVMEMIARGDYFTIKRPHQYGKTTLIYHLSQAMKKDKDYLALDVSFEGIGSSTYESADRFIPAFLELLIMRLRFMDDETDTTALLEKNRDIRDFNELNRFITEFTGNTSRKVVLMIDEVDKSGNNQLFLDFLGMLRNKYLKRNEAGELTFHSVILVGVHDVKSLKIKFRPDVDAKFNCPWNIAVDFKVDLSLLPLEISSMLEEYAAEQKVNLQPLVLAEKIFYYTSGYPFLVSKLCKIIDEEILPHRPDKAWVLEDIDRAVQSLLKENNTNFDSLIKNLENNHDLYELVFKLIMNGAEFLFNSDNPVILFGRIYGILKEEKGKAKIHNRVYEQRIYNYMTSKLETSGDVMFDHITANYLDAGGSLDIKKVFLKFQVFMKEHFGEKDRDFVERNGRLLFLAFIRPIINGRGFDFKEVQVSDEKRLDIVLTFDHKKYIIELKIWRGDAYHSEGIRQLCRYLDVQNEDRGYLLIYDLRKESGQAGKWETLETEGKKILVAWV